MNHRAVPRVRRRAQLYLRHLIAGVAFRASPVRTHHWRLRQHSGRRARGLWSVKPLRSEAKERSSSTSQVTATLAVTGWIWLWYKLICTRDWVESTQSETPESALQSERG